MAQHNLKQAFCYTQLPTPEGRQGCLPLALAAVAVDLLIQSKPAQKITAEDKEPLGSGFLLFFGQRPFAKKLHFLR